MSTMMSEIGRNEPCFLKSFIGDVDVIAFMDSTTNIFIAVESSSTNHEPEKNTNII